MNIVKTSLSYIFLILVAAACNNGAVTGTNYANFEIIDQLTVTGTANETVLSALSTQTFNSYNPMLGFQTESGNTLNLASGDSLSVNINSTQTGQLNSLALGFYNYLNPTAINYANSLNPNSYTFSLNYGGETYITSMSSFPIIYIPQGGTCTTVANTSTGANDTVCTISTTNTVIPYTAGTVSYKLTGTLTSSCLGTVASSSINQDIVRFQNCQIFNNPEVQLQIFANIAVTNTVTGSFNMQGQYYFLSPLVDVIKQ